MKAPDRPSPAPDQSALEDAVAQMAARIAEASSGAEVERTLLGLVHGLVQPRACFVLRSAPDRGLLQVTTVRGRNDPRIAAVRPGEGPAGRAFARGSVEREGGVVAASLGDRGGTGALVLLDSKLTVSDSLARALSAHLAAASEVGRLADIAARRTKDLETAVLGLKSLERTRDELLGGVSHDLKNPLSTIKMNLALLGRSDLGELTERQKRALATCERNADRLLRMINDLLLISHLKDGEMELSDRPFGLKAMAEEAMQALAPMTARAKVKLAFAPASEVFVRGDRAHLREAISHLLESAVQQSAEGDQVEVRTGVADSSLAFLSVKDQGPDVGEEELRHLFDTYRPHPLEPPRRAGGLSLPIAAKIVHLHGGRVEGLSRPGEGLTLTFYLPMFAGAVGQAGGEPIPRGGGILLVEDDADCREVLQQLLELEGYRVISTTGAAQARAILSQVRPALVLLDLKLSEEDGMSVLHFIRGSPALAEVAVYIISGSRDVASLSSGTGLERIDGFFEKPLHLPKVLDTIGAVVRPTRREPPTI
ncbi:MAG: hybrid sensor histidine kinase/response regulator [Myxococcales bacterium]|nr:hybrid sensor histidine kinase/response regulator [Myxococcales bacterium]